MTKNECINSENKCCSCGKVLGDDDYIKEFLFDSNGLCFDCFEKKLNPGKCSICKESTISKMYTYKFKAFDELNPEEKLSLEIVCIDCLKKEAKEDDPDLKRIMDVLGIPWPERQEPEGVKAVFDKE